MALGTIEMDYYEELGLSRDASAEEIRQAYRQVARLLHPDHCSGPEASRLADLQMKRLNGILAVLMDPAARAAYDVRRFQPVRRRARRSPWVGPLAAAIVVLGVLWAVPRVPVPHAATPAAPEPTRVAGAVPAPVRARRTSPRPARAPEMTAAPASGVELPPPTTSTIPVLPEMPVFPLPAVTLPPASAPPRTGLAGEWFFVPRSQTAEQGFYAPEYIELRITEQGGVRTGQYRARYRVPDRAISPVINFRLRGPAEADTALWSGAGGSRGQVTLRLLDRGALEVNWVADQLGSELGLISGSAILVRKAD